MKKENGFWIDENKNRWNCSLYTENNAETCSKSLVDCRGCSGCNDCSDYKKNPQRIVSRNMGSRNSQTYVYWTSSEDVQVICGCFRGNIEQFRNKVNATHSQNEKHLNDYSKFIELVEYVVNFIH